MNELFTLYAAATGSYGGLAAEHTYVRTSDNPNANFNCFGGSAGGRVVRTSTGSSKWAGMIYGPYQGRMDTEPYPAAELRIRYDGVCQIASNRVLIVTHEAIDARETKGNVLATLLYGKFGFNLDRYVKTVKETGAQLLQSDPAEIQQSDIDAVLRRIEEGQSPDAELDLLHSDVQDQEAAKLPDITNEQRELFRPIYKDFQSERFDVFDRISKSVPYGTEIAWKEYPQALIPALAKCVTRLSEALGEENFRNMFGVTPQGMAGKLGGFI